MTEMDPIGVPPDSIAIVGIGGRFPGAADHDALYAALLDERELLRTFTRDELLGAGVRTEQIEDEAYVPVAGIPDGVGDIDLSLFQISPAEAAIMDPQQRLFMECCWAALEDAGCMPDGDPLRTGVFGAVDFNTYLSIAGNPEASAGSAAAAFQIELGNDKEYVASRTSYRLGLTGPSLAIQTACSSSLVAVHYACQSLLLGECDIALAGGSRIHLPLFEGHLHEPGGASSSEGHCRAFDAAASGTVRGSGAAVVSLKRAEDALSDGDHIYGLIIGSAVNNDGADKVGFTAPSVSGQARVIRDAHRVAGVEPAQVSYIETHGTGTALGDPIEVEALTLAFGGRDGGGPSCLLGAIKPNIGHLGAAAGVTGLIKAVMAMETGTVPGTLHFVMPNPELRLESTPFRLSSKAEQLDPERPIAGVSAFGIGGTNAHVVLQVAPTAAPEREIPYHPELFPISAATDTALDTRLDQLRTAILAADPNSSTASFGTTLRNRRSLRWRRSIVVSSSDDAAQQLEQLTDAPTAVGVSNRKRPCLAFPGQGAEVIGAARQLRLRFQFLHEHMTRAERHLRTEAGLDLAAFLEDGLVPSNVARTALVQPALFAVETGLAALLADLGITPDAVIGHSVGDYAAACIAGVFTLEEGLHLTAARGQAMGAMPPGAMTAVIADEPTVRSLLGNGVSIAAINSPTETVIGGRPESLAAVESRLTAAHVRHRRLDVHHAFHTSAGEDAVGALTDALGAVDLRAPEITCVSSATGGLLDANEATNHQHWCRQMCEPVRFHDVIQTVRSTGEYHYIECGPGTTLSHLIRSSKTDLGLDVNPAMGRSPDQEERHFLEAVGRSWEFGSSVKWDRLSQSGVKKIRLPVYPFERSHHWLAGDRPSASKQMPIRSAEPQVRPRSLPQVRKLVADLAAKVLGVAPDTLGQSDPLVELGFESLALLELADLIRRSSGLRLSLANLLDDFPTLEALAQSVLGHIESVTDSLTGEGDNTTAPRSASTEVNPENCHPLAASGKTIPGTDTKDGYLDTDLAAYLDQFLPDYLERTKISKARSAAERVRHADPRSTVGFRRAWKEAVYPIVVDRSAGSCVWDVDGNRYIDLSMGFGVNLLGHGPKLIREALHQQIDRGMQVGPQSALAGDVAAAIHRLTGVERVAFTNSGTEAIMGALRIARAATRRDEIVMFAGSYHGTFDGTLARAKADGNSTPTVLGTPRGMIRDVTVLEYGSDAALEYIDRFGDRIAAILVEPVQSRRPSFQPLAFLQQLRRLCTEHGSVLVFDEVITGFRCHPGGAQALFGVDADLVTYGKILGGGMPIGAIAGRARLLDHLDGGPWAYGDSSAPQSDLTFFAGTFCKHPLAMAAALAILQFFEERGPALQENLADRTSSLIRELTGSFERLGVPIGVQSFSSLFVFDFPPGPLADLWTRCLIHRGVFVWEGRTCFVSEAHSDNDLQQVAASAADAATELNGAQLLRRKPPSTTIPLRDAQEMLALSAALSTADPGSAYEVLAVKCERMSEQDTQAAAQRLLQRHQALRLQFVPADHVQAEIPAEEFEIRYEELGSWDAVRNRISALRSIGETPMRSQFAFLVGPERQAAFVVITPHLFIDEWSMDVLRADLRVLLGLEVGVLEPAPAFTDFLRWEAEAESEVAELHSIWEESLTGIDPTPILTSERLGRRDATATSRQVSVDPAIVDAAARSASERSVTPFAVGLAAWTAALHQTSARNGISVALHVAGQPFFEDARVVGCCLTVLPAHIKLPPRATGSDLLDQATAAVGLARRSVSYPASKLVRSFWGGRPMGAPPFGGTSFQLERAVRSPDTELDLVGRPYTVWDAALTVEISPTGWSAVLTTMKDGLTDVEAGTLLGRFTACLERIVLHPQEPIWTTDPNSSSPRATSPSTAARQRVAGVGTVGRRTTAASNEVDLAP